VAASGVGSDVLGGALAAAAVWHGGAPVPPNPEGGHSLWIFALPGLAVARWAGGGLGALAIARVAVGALIAPLGAALAARLAPRAGAAAAAFAGVALALDPGLDDTLRVAFRGYHAPELLTAAALCAVSAARAGGAGAALGWLGGAWACAIAAAGQHPLGAGAAPGVLLWAARPAAGPGWISVVRARPGLAGLVGLGLLGMVGARLHHLLRLAACPDGAWACLGAVAAGSHEDLAPGALLVRALHDRLLVEGGGPWVVLGLGLALAGRRALPAGLAVSGVVALGLAVSSLRPYHLRVPQGAVAAAAAAGLARLHPAAPLVGALAFGPWALRRPQGPDPGAVARADALGAVVRGLPGPVRVEAAYFGSPVGLDAGAVALSAWLQGAPAAHFDTAPGVPVLLVQNGAGPGRAPPPIAEAGGVALLRFPNLGAARVWLEAHPPAVAGGSFDWARAFAVDPGVPLR
jgi:hypothetical protein